MILAGAVCCKAGVFKPKEKSVLANLLLYLAFMVIFIRFFFTNAEFLIDYHFFF